MRFAIVVQHYGADISGGAEPHARCIPERLSPRTEVRVLTTCTRDSLTWRDEFSPGPDEINGVPVERCGVSRERSFRDVGVRSGRVFGRMHSLQEELDWLKSEGPVSPGFISRRRRSAGEFDFVVLFSVCYHQAYHGARAVPDRAVLRLLDDHVLAGALGRNGRKYFARHYNWPVIERKCRDMFDRLASESLPQRMEPLPGWCARRRPTVPAAKDVLADLPSGPVPAARISSEVPA